ncbi:MAG: protein kinase, partial [Anaerolineae bacterium]|nr:protein kinase [Anaerolineae bacterium]
MIPDMRGSTLGNYLLVERVGSPGVTAVYRASQGGAEGEVAVKLVPVNLAESPDFQARFEEAIETVSQIEHPNLLPLLDYGYAPGFTYLVMPYLPAGSLQARLARGMLAAPHATGIIQQIAAALDEAHRQGVIHGDLKPGNVLFDREGRALVSDVAVTRVLEAALNQTLPASAAMPYYLSPEQGMGYAISHQSDIYSLGVMAYELLTGALPFTADSPVALVFQHVGAPPPSLRQHNPDLPQEVEEVVLKALAKDPTARFASGGELAAALQTAFITAAQAVPVAPTVEPPAAPEPASGPDVPEPAPIAVVEAPPADVIETAPPPPAPALPAELEQARRSSMSGIRYGAVRELANLLAGDDAGLAALARQALVELVADENHMVSQAAATALAAAPEAPAPADAAPQIDTPPAPAPVETLPPAEEYAPVLAEPAPMEAVPVEAAPPPHATLIGAALDMVIAHAAEAQAVPEPEPEPEPVVQAPIYITATLPYANMPQDELAALRRMANARLRSVPLLARSLHGSDREEAAQARTMLAELVHDDSPEVAEAAQVALGQKKALSFAARQLATARPAHQERQVSATPACVATSTRAAAPAPQATAPASTAAPVATPVTPPAPQVTPPASQVSSPAQAAPPPRMSTPTSTPASPPTPQTVFAPATQPATQPVIQESLWERWWPVGAAGLAGGGLIGLFAGGGGTLTMILAGLLGLMSVLLTVGQWGKNNIWLKIATGGNALLVVGVLGLIGAEWMGWIEETAEITEVALVGVQALPFTLGLAALLTLAEAFLGVHSDDTSPQHLWQRWWPVGVTALALGAGALLVSEEVSTGDDELWAGLLVLIGVVAVALMVRLWRRGNMWLAGLFTLSGGVICLTVFLELGIEYDWFERSDEFWDFTHTLEPLLPFVVGVSLLVIVWDVFTGGGTKTVPPSVAQPVAPNRYSTTPTAASASVPASRAPAASAVPAPAQSTWQHWWPTAASIAALAVYFGIREYSTSETWTGLIFICGVAAALAIDQIRKRHSWRSVLFSMTAGAWIIVSFIGINYYFDLVDLYLTDDLVEFIL